MELENFPDWLRLNQVTDRCPMTGKNGRAALVLSNLKTKPAFTNSRPIAFHNHSKKMQFFIELIKQKTANSEFDFLPKLTKTMSQVVIVVIS